MLPCRSCKSPFPASQIRIHPIYLTDLLEAPAVVAGLAPGGNLRCRTCGTVWLEQTRDEVRAGGERASL